MAPEHERLKLLIAYHGAGFRGWQSQATRDAIQDYMEGAFAKITQTKISVQGSGRTDAGVHALGQVAHADVPLGKLSCFAWQSALNACLPREIRVLRATRARPGFHARFDASGKTYIYRICNASFLHPMELGRAWHLPGPLDASILTAGAALLTGTHDFAGFAANRGHPPANTVRTLHRIAVARRGAMLTLRFEGSGFLYKMVRLLTGALVRCAQGRADLSFISGLLSAKGARKTSFSAPAEGLYLVRVHYGKADKGNDCRSALHTRMRK
jgi:tRNA pseudouridine38-40 synthase